MLSWIQLLLTRTRVGRKVGKQHFICGGCSNVKSGHPKPIPTTNRDFLADIRVRAAAKYAGASAYAPLPLFHVRFSLSSLDDLLHQSCQGMGFYAFTRWPMSSGLIPTFVNMKQPLNAQALLRHLKRLPGSISFLPPIVLEEAIRESSLDLSVLASCKRIFFGGAPMNHALAQALIERGVPLVGAFGSSVRLSNFRASH